MTANNYNYPEITKGLGELTPAMWARLMSMLRYFENLDQDLSSELSNEVLHDRISELEHYKPYFFAKLLRAHVLDESLNNPNVYEYAWVEVLPKTGTPECCGNCLETRDKNNDTCCLNECSSNDPALNLQGFYQWEENLNHTSWGSYMSDNIGFQDDNSYLRSEEVV